MSTYTDASLIVTPNAVKADKLYSLKGADLDAVRNTTATYVGADGLIKTALANVLRLDYTNGSCPSILVEPQRTNLVFPSATATTQSRTVTAVAHTLSFYGTGTVVLSGVATGTLVGTGATNKVTLTFTPTAGTLILTVVGSVTNWQLEAGSNATSHIPTTTTTVTRNADLISKSGISDLIGQTEGTIFAYLSFKEGSERFNGIELFGNSNNRIYIFKDTTDRVIFGGKINGIIYDSNLYTSNYDFFKVAIIYNSTQLKVYINGSLFQTRSFSTSFTTALSILNFRLINNVLYNFQGELKNYAVYETQLSDAEAIQLTTL